MNSTIAWITARGLFGRRRFLLLFPLPLIFIGITALAASIDTADEFATPVLVGIGVAVVLPLVALIVGTGVLGSEIDDGTIVHILTKPVPRWKIVLSKMVVASAVTAFVAGGSAFVAGWMTDGPKLGLALAAAMVIGAIAYCSLFLALSVVSRRPVLIGLLYIAIWEGLLSNVVSGTRVLSVQQYVVTLAQKLAGTDLLMSTVKLPAAIIMTVVVTLGGLYLAITRLRSFSVAGETS
ncbi:ABC transporter permease subunit [Catelliglobosispora koreensis]|uniref:ABC transporter permease subunit n=1 Tax=Catelliglobosispora koreensis TaxID=129052 RepID=UPI0003666CA9|nr:ABC transporter permease subunit [Catelliglobosispora koreensis]